MPLDEAGWNWLVRRALGVPDLIGDEVAMEIIDDAVFSHPLVKGDRPTNSHDEIAERITQEILDTLCRMGRQGDLDCTCWTDPSSRFNASPRDLSKRCEGLLVSTCCQKS